MTILVGRNDRYAGVGSKQLVVMGAGVIMQVEENVFSQGGPTAVIENLIIDGQGYGGTTGIYLENACGCLIRNVTIRNCEVGIHLRNVGGWWTELNHLQHIWMSNVKTGILFTTAGEVSPNKGTSFGHSYIDDVGIKLKNTTDAVGIQIGNNSDGLAVQPYFAFLKANIWLNSLNDCCGVKLVNGELKHGLINLGVYGKGTGYGIDISEATAPVNSPPIAKNQRANSPNNMKGVLLCTQNLTKAIRNKNDKVPSETPYDVSDITTVSL